MIRIHAVIVDNAMPGGEPVVVEFDHDGPWYEGLDMLVSQYAALHRGGTRNIDADNLELRSCSIMNVGDLQRIIERMQE